MSLSAIHAASVAHASEAPAEASTPSVLAPIVVTGTLPAIENYKAGTSSSATLTDTQLRDIPQTINIVGREEIRDRQVREVGEVLESIPGVIKYGSSGNRSETFILRGFRAGGYAIDGMQLNATADRPEVMQDLAGVERVEVLKGPASVLYGIAEPGGIINIVTRRPEARRGFDASVTYGSYGLKRGEASATGALNEDGTLRGRITGAAQKEDGWVRGRPGSERQYIGGVLEWDPTADTRLSFSLDHTAVEQPFDRGLVLVPSTGEVLRPYDSWLGESWSMVDGEKTRGMFKAEHVVSDALTLRTSYGFDFGRVKDTGIDHQGLRGDGRTLRRRYSDRVEDTQTQDLRLEALWRFDTGGVDHQLLTGMQYVRSQMEFERARANIDAIDIFNPVHGAIRPIAKTNSVYDERVHTRAVYLQDQISLSEQWKMLAGVRWDEYRMRRDASVGESVDARTDNSMTGRFGLVWQPRTDLSLYGSWTQSFHPQTGHDETGASLDPEEGTQYELGVKWEPIPDRLSANLAIFQITKKNVATSDPANPNADYSLLTGEQRSRGAELEIVGQILPGWKAHAGAGYVDAKVTKDNADLVGNRLNGVPRFSASLWTTYTIQEGIVSGLTFGGGVTHVGSRKGDLNNSFEVDGYNRFDAMARYTMQNGVDISLVVNNVFDEKYIVSTQSDREILAGAPRTAQLMVGWTF
ncbi:MAG: TonB-dependent siderophore receptor [Rhodocyclaceae bacterium]